MPEPVSDRLGQSLSAETAGYQRMLVEPDCFLASRSIWPFQKYDLLRACPFRLGRSISLSSHPAGASPCSNWPPHSNRICHPRPRREPSRNIPAAKSAAGRRKRRSKFDLRKLSRCPTNRLDSVSATPWWMPRRFDRRFVLRHASPRLHARINAAGPCQCQQGSSGIHNANPPATKPRSRLPPLGTTGWLKV